MPFSSKFKNFYNLKMTTESTELNKFLKIKTKIEMIKQCIRKKMYPNFIQVKLRIKNSRSLRVVENAKKSAGG